MISEGGRTSLYRTGVSLLSLEKNRLEGQPRAREIILGAGASLFGRRVRVLPTLELCP